MLPARIKRDLYGHWFGRLFFYCIHGFLFLVRFPDNYLLILPQVAGSLDSQSLVSVF